MTSCSESQIAGQALAVHPVATLVVDLEGRVLYSNSAARKMFGLAKSSGPTPCSISDWKMRRMPLAELLRTASISSNWIPALLSRDDQTVHAKARGLRADGSKRPRVLITSVSDSTAPFLAHAQQIEELNSQLALYQKTAMELQVSVEVSKVLERELVHRVKNNLAIISALLNQQARSAGDQIVSDALINAASRIKSIAVVHDILDANQQTEFVDLAELLDELIDGIRDALCPKHILVETETKSVKVHIDVALPLALLVNELVTNAMKHAFVGRKSGRIDVKCANRNAEFEIRIVDDGIGIPSDATGKTREPRMIMALAEQVGGTIECRVEEGTEWTIRFPADAPRTLAPPV